MQPVTILWSVSAGVALTLAMVCGVVWLSQRRDVATLMLCALGVATAAAAYGELGMMHAATAAEYGDWLRWYHVPNFIVLIGQLLFVQSYIGTGRRWILWTVIVMRCLVLAVNFSVSPNFNFESISSLRQASLFGEPISAIQAAVPRREWVWFSVASLGLIFAYLVDAALQQWRKGGTALRRKALVVGWGIAGPLLITILYSQLIVFRVISAPLSNLPWFLGVQMVIAVALGRDFVLSWRAQGELAELRVRLAQEERVNLVGRLASALAHELAQPLGASLMNAEAAQIHLRNGPPRNPELLRSILDEIRTDNRRAVDIISRLRQLMKRSAIAMQPLAIEVVVRDVESLVHTEAASHRIGLHLHIPPGLPSVLGDRVHLSQVLLNLLMNSIHAVRSQPVDARRIVVKALAKPAHGEIHVTVRDSGPGIPAAIAPELFRPFFTTKADGMGMGLALSRTIIEAHGGRLWAEHVADQKGADFRFSLRQA